MLKHPVSQKNPNFQLNWIKKAKQKAKVLSLLVFTDDVPVMTFKPVYTEVLMGVWQVQVRALSFSVV